MTEKSIRDLHGKELVNALEVEFSRRRKAMTTQYRKWDVIENFLAGKAWVSWESGLSKLVDYYNVLKSDRDLISIPRTQEYLAIMQARLATSKPNLICLPPSQSPEHIASAKASNNVLKHIDRVNDSDAVDNNIHHDKLVYGTSIEFINWNKIRGDWEVVNEVVNPREILPRLSSRGDFNEVMRYRIVEVQTVKDTYGDKARGMEAEYAEGEAVSDKLFQDAAERFKEPVILKEYFVEGDDQNKNGRYVVWANGALLVDDNGDNQEPDEDNLIFPDGKVPFVRHAFKEKSPKTFWAESYVSALIPLNITLNKTITLANSYLERAIRAWIAVERNSNVDIDQFSEGRDIISCVPYNAGSLPPTPIQLPAMVIDIWKQIDMIEAQMQDIGFVHNVSKGKSERNVRSAAGMAHLREADESPLRVTVDDFLRGRVESAQMKLELAKNYDDGKLLKINSPSGESITQEFKKADIVDELSVIVEPNSGMPSSHAEQTQIVLELAKVGLLNVQDPKNQRAAFEMLQYNSLQAIFKMDEAAKAEARRENEAFKDGTEFEPVIYKFQNHKIHHEIHQAMILSEEFIDWDQSAKDALIQHDERHTPAEMKFIEEETAKAMAAQGMSPSPEQEEQQALAETK